MEETDIQCTRVGLVYFN